jgi:hypothetical protein
LVAFLPAERLVTPIETIEDLARQTEIRYGVVKGGSTAAFFNQSTRATIETMWNFMLKHKDDVLVQSTQAGIEKVRRSKGRIADTEILFEVLALVFSRAICLSLGVYIKRIRQRTSAM